MGRNPADGPVAEDFEQVWPLVAARLQRMLAARGLSPEAADDICQEVGCRVLARGVRYRTADELYPWAATVARRLTIDLHRRERHLAATEPPERPAEDDVVELVEARTRLRAVAAALSSLPPGDREAITGAIGSPAAASRREAVRAAVRRHRARARLLAMIDAAGAVLAWLVSRVTRRVPRPVGVAAAVAAPALLLALSVGPRGPDPYLQQAEPADRLERPTRASRGASPAAAAARPAPRPRAAQASSSAAAPRPARRADPTDVRILARGPGGEPLVHAEVRDRRPDDEDVCVSVLPSLRACASPTAPLLEHLPR